MNFNMYILEHLHGEKGAFGTSITPAKISAKRDGSKQGNSQKRQQSDQDGKLGAFENRDVSYLSLSI